MDPPVSEWAVRRPAGGLARFVDRFVGYRMTGLEPGLHRGLPSRYLTFIVSVGEDIDVVAHTDPRQAPGRYRAVLSGLQASPALIAYGWRQEGVAIELTPAGARALFGVPARALWDTTVELTDVCGAIGVELWERLQEPVGWQARFDVVDELLGRLAQPWIRESPLERVWHLVTEGTSSIETVAGRVGWSRQHLTRRFGEEFGVAPKLAERIARFERARRMMEATPPPGSLAQVAWACGYYDQAHMNRDFVAFAGCPPGRLLADEVPLFQDDAARDARSSGHEHFAATDLAHPGLP